MLWTYIYPNNSKGQLDYTFRNRKCEAYSSFEGVSSDHRIVSETIRLSLRRNKKINS